VGEKLRLKPHLTGRTPKTIYGPGDIEGHEGTDSRFVRSSCSCSSSFSSSPSSLFVVIFTRVKGLGAKTLSLYCPGTISLILLECSHPRLPFLPLIQRRRHQKEAFFIIY
jgi:hypothetical protein